MILVQLCVSSLNIYIYFLLIEYVEPFLSELSILSNFSVKSQWLYLLPLDVSPKRVPDSGPLGRHFALSEDVLPQLITPLEKKLGMLFVFSPPYEERNKICNSNIITIYFSLTG